jgi:hypothetical protein
VSTYRRMRRQARVARRSGLQPMMVINSGESFPETAAAVLARCIWRYRSELAPIALALTLLGTSVWLHSAHRQWWGIELGVSCAAACGLYALAPRIGMKRLSERLHAASATLACGAWLGAATQHGPFRSPLPQNLAIETLTYAIPWWAHRRRRAKVRVDRKLAAWPDIAKSVGLAGSQVMSAVVDIWGWRARFRLARGQTISDVIARIPAIESGLGTFRGAVRVYPTPDDKANRCEIRVLDIDPHAGAIPWAGPSAASINEPIDLGPFEDASPCKVLFVRQHGIFGGTTGSGKSGGLNVLMGNLAACGDVVIWAIDLKRGMELGPWQSCIGRLATTPEQAITLLRDAVTILEARAELLAATGKRVWEPSPQMPAIVIVIDEYAELTDEAPEAMPYADSIARLGRALAVTVIAATQRPTQKAMGQGAVRSQMDIRICFRVRERKDVDLVLGQGMLGGGWDAQNLNAPGKFLVSAPGHTTPKRARAYLVTDEAVTETAARYAGTRPGLDAVSRQALTPRPATLSTDTGPRESRENTDTQLSTENVLWRALCQAPDDGADIGELMRVTGWKRTTLYRHLREHADSGRAIQVSRGRWRAPQGR